jgi:hypothetical protein
VSGKLIECREMLKHEPGMVEDISYGNPAPRRNQAPFQAAFRRHPYLRLVTQNLEEPPLSTLMHRQGRARRPPAVYCLPCRHSNFGLAIPE